METNGLSERIPFGIERSPTQGPAWAVADFSLSVGVDSDTVGCIERLLTRRVGLQKGGLLYRAGDRFTAVYALRSGWCKTMLLAQGGQGQIAGYYMPGDVIGMDGIGAERHDCQAIALDDMEVCPIPCEQIENLARRSLQFQRNLYKLLAQETKRARTLMLMLGTMRAEQRLAVFLLDMSQRHLARGYSSCEFVMRMTREEIGTYLGLKLETVSRLFSRFQHEGLILVQGRAVKMLDQDGVRQLVVGNEVRDNGAGVKSADAFAVKSRRKTGGTPLTLNVCTVPA